MLACRSWGPHVCHVRYLQWGCWADAARQSPATRTVLRAPAPGAAASNQIIWALCDKRHLRPGRLPMRAPAALRAARSEHREQHAGQRAARRSRRRRGHRRPWRAQGHAGLHGARDDDRAVRGQARGRRLLARRHARRAADGRRHAAPRQPGAAPAALSFPFHSALKFYNEACGSQLELFLGQRATGCGGRGAAPGARCCLLRPSWPLAARQPASSAEHGCCRPGRDKVRVARMCWHVAAAYRLQHRSMPQSCRMSADWPADSASSKRAGASPACRNFRGDVGGCQLDCVHDAKIPYCF